MLLILKQFVHFDFMIVYTQLRNFILLSYGVETCIEKWSWNRYCNVLIVYPANHLENVEKDAIWL